MNKHFHDSAYYLQRAGEHAKLGVVETFDPVLERVRSLLGRDSEPEPEPGRVETVLVNVREVETRAKDEARVVAGGARAKFGQYRTAE